MQVTNVLIFGIQFFFMTAYLTMLIILILGIESDETDYIILGAILMPIAWNYLVQVYTILIKVCGICKRIFR